MRAFVVTGPRAASVVEVEPPSPRPDQVVVDVARVGVCGTDIEFFTGEMEYLRRGHARYPMRLGHEWSGTVSAAGETADRLWIGRRVTGDTMLGCGHCRRCLDGRHWLCAERMEIGVRGGFPGALAEQIAVPQSALHGLPPAIDEVAGAMVEPGGNALRVVRAADLARGDRVLILGMGTIGLLAAMFARSAGAEVFLLGRSERSVEFARTLGFEGVWRAADLPNLPWKAVIDASNAPDLPTLAVDMVEPGGRVVYVGLAGAPSLIDTRSLALKAVTAVGVLSGSDGLAGTIDAYAAGLVDPRPLVAATVGLDQVGAVLAGWRPEEAGGGPKVIVDPRR